MSTQGASGALRKLWTVFERLGHLARAGQWWDYKLAPIFAAFYASALVLQTPVSSLGWGLAQLFLAMVPGAAYVSLINDLTDEADDRAAGKPNRMAGRSAAGKVVLNAPAGAKGPGVPWPRGGALPPGNAPGLAGWPGPPGSRQWAIRARR